jgi:hypothetical protein
MARNKGKVNATEVPVFRLKSVLVEVGNISAHKHAHHINAIGRG